MNKGEDDPAVQRYVRWTRALVEHRQAEIRDQVNLEEIDSNEMFRFFDRARRKDDRSVALLLYAHVDDFLLNRFKSIVHRHTDELLGFERPLFHSYPRLLLAHDLGWISDDTYSGLNMMRKIRHEFAHNSEIDHFSEEPVRGFVSSIPKAETLLYEKDAQRAEAELNPHETLTVRDLYLVRCAHLIGHSAVELISFPAFLKAGLTPYAVFPKDLSETPNNVKHLIATTIDMMLSICGKPDQLKKFRRQGQTLEQRYAKWVQNFDDAMREC